PRFRPPLPAGERVGVRGHRTENWDHAIRPKSPSRLARDVLIFVMVGRRASTARGPSPPRGLRDRTSGHESRDTRGRRSSPGFGDLSTGVLNAMRGALVAFMAVAALGIAGPAPAQSWSDRVI